MKNLTAKLSMLASKVEPQHVKLIVILLSLGLLVLGIGAPSGGGGTVP